MARVLGDRRCAFIDAQGSAFWRTRLASNRPWNEAAAAPSAAANLAALATRSLVAPRGADGRIRLVARRGDEAG